MQARIWPFFFLLFTYIYSIFWCVCALVRWFVCSFVRLFAAQWFFVVFVCVRSAFCCSCHRRCVVDIFLFHFFFRSSLSYVHREKIYANYLYCACLLRSPYRNAQKFNKCIPLVVAFCRFVLWWWAPFVWSLIGLLHSNISVCVDGIHSKRMHFGWVAILFLRRIKTVKWKILIFFGCGNVKFVNQIGACARTDALPTCKSA